MQRIAVASQGHEEEAVWTALAASGLLMQIPSTEVDLGPELSRFPYFTPRHLIQAVAARGCMHRIIGMPWESRYSAAHHWKPFHMLHNQVSLFWVCRMLADDVFI